MISIREALTIKDGHIIHDHCGRTLKVNNYSIVYEKGLPTSVEFGCRDIYTNERLIYTYDEIYIDFDSLSDETKLFLSWLRQNQECYYLHSDDIRSLKTAFMSGFNAGLSYKLQQSSQEQLQK